MHWAHESPNHISLSAGRIGPFARSLQVDSLLQKVRILAVYLPHCISTCSISFDFSTNVAYFWTAQYAARQRRMFETPEIITADLPTRCPIAFPMIGAQGSSFRYFVDLHHFANGDILA